MKIIKQIKKSTEKIISDRLKVVVQDGKDKYTVPIGHLKELETPEQTEKQLIGYIKDYINGVKSLTIIADVKDVSSLVGKLI